MGVTVGVVVVVTDCCSGGKSWSGLVFAFFGSFFGLFYISTTTACLFVIIPRVSRLVALSANIEFVEKHTFFFTEVTSALKASVRRFSQGLLVRKTAK